MQNIKEQYSLFQSDSDGFLQLMHCFSLDQVNKKIMSATVNIQLVEKLNLKPHIKDEVFKKIKKNFKDSFKIHEQLLLLSKKGELIVIASAVLDHDDENLILYDFSN